MRVVVTGAAGMIGSNLLHGDHIIHTRGIEAVEQIAADHAGGPGDDDSQANSSS